MACHSACTAASTSAIIVAEGSSRAPTWRSNASIPASSGSRSSCAFVMGLLPPHARQNAFRPRTANRLQCLAKRHPGPRQHRLGRRVADAEEFAYLLDAVTFDVLPFQYVTVARRQAVQHRLH